MAKSDQYCTVAGCGLSGDCYGDCGRSITPCPEPATATKASGAGVKCTSCGRTWIISIDNIAGGKVSKRTCCKNQKLTYFDPFPKARGRGKTEKA